MEQVIPRYLVDMAVEKCHETLKTKVDVKTEIKKCVNYLKSYHDVDLEVIEEKLGMKYDAFGGVQYTTIRKWVASLKDGICKKEDIFPTRENKNKTVEEVNKQQQTEMGSIKATYQEVNQTATPEQTNSDDEEWFK